MPGKTRTRCKDARPCGMCSKPIQGGFNRTPKADYHEDCFFEKLKAEKNKGGLPDEQRR